MSGLTVPFGVEEAGVALPGPHTSCLELNVYLKHPQLVMLWLKIRDGRIRSRGLSYGLKYHRVHTAGPYTEQWSLAFTLEIRSSQIVFYRIEEALELLKVLLLKKYPMLRKSGIYYI